MMLNLSPRKQKGTPKRAFLIYDVPGLRFGL